MGDNFFQAEAVAGSASIAQARALGDLGLTTNMTEANLGIYHGGPPMVNLPAAGPMGNAPKTITMGSFTMVKNHGYKQKYKFWRTVYSWT